MANIEGKDGTQYSDVGLTFIFKDVRNVRMAQFVQKEKGKVNLNVVADPRYSDADEKRIRTLLEEKIGYENMDIEIRLIDEAELLYGKNNKLALVVRESKSEV